MNGLSRRQFAESLALAALVPLIGAPPGAIHLSEWDKALPVGVAEPGALARALADVIQRQYGSRLSASDIATITGQIQTGLERIDQLRKVQLTNGDEPDFVFTAARRSPPAP